MRHVNKGVLPGANLLGAGQSTGNGPAVDIVSALQLCSLIPLIMIVRSVFDYLNAYYMAWVSLRVLADIRTKLYTHIIGQSLDFFNKERSGNLISRVINDTRVAQNALTNISSDIIKQPVAIIGTVSVLLYLDWKFAIFSLVLFPVCLVPIVVFGRRVRKQGRLEEQKVGSMMSLLQESFAGVRVIKSFAREQRESKQFEQLNLEQFRSGIKVRKAIEIVGPTIEGVSAIGVGIALLYVWW